MRCAKCGKDTPTNYPYCMHCGAKVVLKREDALAVARQQAKREKEAYTARNVRKLLVYAVAFFIVAMVLFIVTRGTVTVSVSPAYPYLNPPPNDLARGDTGKKSDAPPGTPKVLIEVQDSDVWDDMPMLAPEK